MKHLPYAYRHPGHFSTKVLDWLRHYWMAHLQRAPVSCNHHATGRMQCPSLPFLAFRPRCCQLIACCVFTHGTMPGSFAEGRVDLCCVSFRVLRLPLLLPTLPAVPATCYVCLDLCAWRPLIASNICLPYLPGQIRTRLQQFPPTTFPFLSVQLPRILHPTLYRTKHLPPHGLSPYDFNKDSQPRFLTTGKPKSARKGIHNPAGPARQLGQ